MSDKNVANNAICEVNLCYDFMSDSDLAGNTDGAYTSVISVQHLHSSSLSITMQCPHLHLQ